MYHVSEEIKPKTIKKDLMHESILEQINVVYTYLSKAWNAGRNIRWKQSNFFVKCIHAENSRYHVSNFTSHNLNFNQLLLLFFIFSEVFWFFLQIVSFLKKYSTTKFFLNKMSQYAFFQHISKVMMTIRETFVQQIWSSTFSIFNILKIVTIFYNLLG